MDYSLLLIKALNVEQNPSNEEMMPALVLTRDVSGTSKLVLRNSINIRKVSANSDPNYK